MSAGFDDKGEDSLASSWSGSVPSVFSNKVHWEVPRIVGFNFSCRYWFLIFKHLHGSIFFLFFFLFWPSLTFHLKCIFFLKYFLFSINVVHFILVFELKHFCCWAFFICFVYLIMYLYFPVCLLFVLYNKFILSWFYCFFLIYICKNTSDV